MVTSPQNRPSETQLIDALQVLADDLGRPPSVEDVEEQSDQIAVDYIAQFGSWDAALEAAGISPRTARDRTTSDALLAALRRASDSLGHTPEPGEVSEHTDWTADAYARRFGSYHEACEAAGVDAPEYDERIASADLESELRRLAADLDRPPRDGDLIKRGAYAPEAYRNRYGSLADARTAAGISV